MLMSYVALMIAILIGVGGQIAIKAGSLSGVQIAGIPLLQPYTILGLSCYFASALFYIYALKQIPVSVAFPSVSLSYIIVALIAHFLWQEPFGMQHIFAMLLILSGVFLLVRAS
jgi:undecaprenyl phosphate-alpha-L-ara4N flippase subunit ArnE